MKIRVLCFHLINVQQIYKEEIMRFLRHLVALLGSFCGIAWDQKKWWIFPVVFIMLLMALVIVVGQTSAPFIYTLF